MKHEELFKNLYFDEPKELTNTAYSLYFYKLTYSCQYAYNLCMSHTVHVLQNYIGFILSPLPWSSSSFALKNGEARTRNEERLYLRFPLFEILRTRHELPLWWLNDLTISESCPGWYEYLGNSHMTWIEEYDWSKVTWLEMWHTHTHTRWIPREMSERGKSLLILTSVCFQWCLQWLGDLLMDEYAS